MKLLAGLAASAAADSYVTCNSFATNAVEMKMMIDIADVQDAAGPGADWTKNDADTQWQKTITPTADDTTEETEGTAKFLQVTKVVDSEGCAKKTVDGVEVCVAKGHQFTFTCKYPLADQTVSTAQDFTVSGSDTTDSATGIGSLNYALAVDAGNTFAIGNTVTATITPDSSGLVTATILSCEVTNKDVASQSVSVIKTQAGSCSTECAAGWTLLGSNGESSCFKRIGKQAASEGAAACASLGAHLPLPVNQQNNADMRAVFNVLGAEHTLLDGNDVNVENEWRRADGTSVEYFNWGAGEPNTRNPPRNTEDYIAMWNNGNWNDVVPIYGIHIVCQQDMLTTCISDMQEPTCALGVTISTGQGDSTLGFAFDSFKWSTSKVGNNDVAENQDLTCAIALAKSPPTVNSIGCA